MTKIQSGRFIFAQFTVDSDINIYEVLKLQCFVKLS